MVARQGLVPPLSLYAVLAPADSSGVATPPMQSSLWGPVDPLRLASPAGEMDGDLVGPGMVVGSTGWDVGRPLLAAVLARMEDLSTPTVKTAGSTITYHPLLSVTPTGILSGARPETDPFDLDALLREQMSEAELVMAALRGVPTEHHAIAVGSRLPTLVPSEVGPDGRDLCLRIQVTWGGEREMVVHSPMTPMKAHS